MEDSCFVKFNVKDQITRLKRTLHRDTLDWWKKQHHHVRKLSFDPSPADLIAEDGIQVLHNYMAQFPNAQNKIIFARGSLDQMVIDSVARSVKMEPIAQYNMWRDCRTFIDCVYGSKNGYCDIEYEGFQRYNVIKHCPINDIALDVMMILYGKL